MIRKLAILGATGDLTARYLLPGLAALRAAGELSDGFQFVAVGRQNWTDETFRNWAAAQLDRHATALPPSVFPGAVSALHRAGTAAGSIVVLEKPFGEELGAAIALNRLLSSLYPEQAIFRV